MNKHELDHDRYASGKLVSIIVVSFNTRKMTLECLRSVQRETNTRYEIIVVDNASSDGSAEAIAEEFPDIQLIEEKQNLGFAKANNVAGEMANGDYILLLNPDTVVLNKAIDRLVEFAVETANAKIWGGRTLFGDLSLNPGSCWRKMSVWNIFCRSSGLSGIFNQSEFFNSEGYGAWDRKTEREVDIVCGCFLLLESSLWKQLGGFDLSYVMYGEEADLCLRARAFDARPRITPHAEIIHYGGASETVRLDKMVRLLNAKALLIQRHFDPLFRGVGLWMFKLWPLTRYWAFGCLSVLPGQQHQREIAQLWKALWSRRGEWENGYRSLSKDGPQ